VGDGVEAFEFDDLVGQQPQGPAVAARRRRAARKSDQSGRDCAIDLVRARFLGPPRVERRLQPLLDEAPSHPLDGRPADRDFVRNGLVRKPLVGFEQDARVDQPSGGPLALGDQCLQQLAFGIGESDDVFLDHISRIHLLTRSINLRMTEH
jgi:hypothetical protein